MIEFPGLFSPLHILPSLSSTQMETHSDSLDQVCAPVSPHFVSPLSSHPFLVAPGSRFSTAEKLGVHTPGANRKHGTDPQPAFRLLVSP